jgi:hypothetical protein
MIITGAGTNPTRPVASARNDGAKPEIGLRREQRGAARNAHGAERHNERRQPAVADEKAVHQAGCGADRERDRQRQRERLRIAQGHPEDHARQRDDRSDGQIDAARHDHIRHPDRNDRVDARLLGDVQQIR